METCLQDNKHEQAKCRAVDIEPISCEDNDVEQQLIDRLLRGHDKHVRPVLNRNDNVNVGFDVSYNQLVDLVRISFEKLMYLYTSIVQVGKSIFSHV